MQAGLPTGTVTFLFTDIEGSTGLLQELGGGYGEALAEHRRVLREAWAQHGGAEVDTQGDAFFVAFARASDAVAAAVDAQAALADGPVRVRMGLHTGEPIEGDEGYAGMDVHRAARIAAAGRELNNLGDARFSLGDSDGALELYRRALTAAVEIGAVSMLADALSGIAVCEAEAGKPVVAARLLGHSDALGSSLGHWYHTEEEKQTLATAEAALGSDRFAAEVAAGAGMPVEDAVELALGPAEPKASANA